MTSELGATSTAVRSSAATYALHLSHLHQQQQQRTHGSERVATMSSSGLQRLPGNTPTPHHTHLYLLAPSSRSVAVKRCRAAARVVARALTSSTRLLTSS